jgi:hypothetical protein
MTFFPPGADRKRAGPNLETLAEGAEFGSPQSAEGARRGWSLPFPTRGARPFFLQRLAQPDKSTYI